MYFTRKLWVTTACFVLGLLMAVPSDPAYAAKDVTFSLDWIPLGRHAPFYTALEKGFFKEEGLNVKIIPGKGSAATVQAVVSDLADLGFIGVLGTTLAHTKGVNLKMVAIMYQKVPYAIFSLKSGANVTKASQLEGLTLGSSATSATPKVIRGFMVQKGLDPSKLKIENIAPSARASMLLAGKVPSIETFILSQPKLEKAARTANDEMKTYLLGDHGLQLYSNGITAKESYIKANPDVVKGFVRAALRGYKYALDNPEEAADLQRKHFSALNKAGIVTELKIVKRLAVTEDTKANGLGWINPAKMESSLGFLVKNVDLKGSIPKAKDLYLEGFLPSAPIKP